MVVFFNCLPYLYIMKKIILIIGISSIISCDEIQQEQIKNETNKRIENSRPVVVEINNNLLKYYVIDSCEYIGNISDNDLSTNYLTHKGNCKFCKNR